MAIHTEEEEIKHGGMKKQLNAGAMEMIMRNLQQSQYQHPMKSAVREVVSNGLDSIMERDMAKAILSGEKAVEDYFEDRKGEVYADSKFDPEYYDLKWLSTDPNVRIDYYVGENLEKDKVVITDFGVGLGGKRLAGYTQLGYSSKRLSKMPLGKFGIGGKAPLAVNDSFIMESDYNGKRFRLQILNSDIISITPRFNFDTGKVNESYLLNEGTDNEYKMYYENVTTHNKVSITMEALKHHQQKYIDAVREQLLYFNNIILSVHEKGKPVRVIDYKAKIFYEDEYIVLSDNNFWSKPHLLLNKVNYGYIDWQELQLEDKTGNIGIKIAPEDVEVNPSRESVVWREKTKQMVLRRFDEVVNVATKFIQKELAQTDLVDWIRTCGSMSNRHYGGDSVVARLSRIVDLGNINPAFHPNPKIKYTHGMWAGFILRAVDQQEITIANRKKKVIQRNFREMLRTGYPIYLMEKDEKVNNRKDKWLMKEAGTFDMIVEPVTFEDAQELGYGQALQDIILSYKRKEGQATRYEMWEELCKSREIKWYKDVEVPEDFKANEEEIEEVEEIIEEEEEETVEDVEPVKKLTPAQRRKLEGKIMVTTPRLSEWNHLGQVFSEDPKTDPIELRRVEVKLAEMGNWDNEEIYYSIPDQDELLRLVTIFSVPVHSPLHHPTRKEGWRVKDWSGTVVFKANQVQTCIELGLSNSYTAANNHFYMQHWYLNPEIRLFRVKKEDKKYMSGFRSIEKFFLQIRNNVITMSNLLVRWNTARLIKEKLDKMPFMRGFGSINEHISASFIKLDSYVKLNYREVEKYADSKLIGLNPETYAGLIGHLDKVQEFQEFVRKGASMEEIAAMATYMFGNPELQDGMAYDPEIVDGVNELWEYFQGVGPMLNYIKVFTSQEHVGMELEGAVKELLEFKGMLNFKTKLEREEEMKQHFLVHGGEVEVAEDGSSTVEDDLSREEVEEMYDELSNI